jgi:hypothetical protein
MGRYGGIAHMFCIIITYILPKPKPLKHNDEVDKESADGAYDVYVDGGDGHN